MKGINEPQEVWAHHLRYHLRTESSFTHKCGLVKASVSALLSRLKAGFSSLPADPTSRSQFLSEYTEGGFMVSCWEWKELIWNLRYHSLCSKLMCVHNRLIPWRKGCDCHVLIFFNFVKSHWVITDYVSVCVSVVYCLL